MIYRQDQAYLDEAFHLSLQLMYEYLVRAVTLIGKKAVFQGFDIPAVRFNVLLDSDRLVAKRMKQVDGWCVSDIHMLQELSSTTELVFASSLNTPGPNKTHPKCNKHKCLAYKVEDGDYTTKHAAPDCACEFVYASRDALCASLCGGFSSIPLIAPSDPCRHSDGRLYVTLLPPECSPDRTAYIAISHVWSDGLGNEDSNSIPLCQFNRIVKLTTRLNRNTSIAFWLDTLCFPLAPQDAYDQALIRMRQSYEDANKVLVFDAYLLEHDASGMSEEEVAMRIACAPWNRRLWTLQEGVLAHSLAFQFRDSYIDLTDWTTRRGHPTTLRNLMFVTTWTRFASLRALETEKSKKMSIVQAKKALTWRSTSVEEDEPLCLGNILGIDPESVVKTSVKDDPARTRDERMKVIWRSLPKHYSSTVFWNSPKLQDRGFRWAASSLISGDSCGRVRTCIETATWHPGSGLLVTLPGITISRSPIQSPQTFRVYLHEDWRLMVQWDNKKHFPAAMEIETYAATACNFAILLNRPLKEDDSCCFARLCAVVNSGDGTTGTRLRLLGRIRLYRVEKLHHHPDIFLAPGTSSLLNVAQPQAGSLQARAVTGSRGDAVWDNDESEIASGTVVEEKAWYVD